MSNTAKALAALSALALAVIAAAPAQAEIICDDDGCRPALILSEPTLLLGDDCGCE
jgi:hypothetical protein